MLSLYLSTAVEPLHVRARAKFLAALVPLLCLTLLPVLLLFVGNTFFADSATSYLADHWLDLLRIIASGLCSPSTSASSGSRWRRSRAGARSRSAATRR